jgi:hypothetical protein
MSGFRAHQRHPAAGRAVLAAGLCIGMILSTALPDTAQLMPGYKPMDLISSDQDLNGFPRNPDWYGQTPLSPGGAGRADIDASALCDYFRYDGGTLRTDRCTTQSPTVDERRPIRGALPDLVGYVCRFAYDKREQLERDSVHGHVNWRVATYTGAAYFDDFQDPAISFRHLIPGDGDLDFTLVRADHRGYVKGSADQDHVGHDPGIVMEANRFELGALDTPWWSDVRHSFETDPAFAGARTSLHGAYAIATGLVGIDTKHGAHTELHPLFALFARTTAEGVLPQHWVFFARNWGYEGGCSKDLHALGRDALKVELPVPPAGIMANVVVSPAAARDWVSFQSGGASGTMTVRLPLSTARPVVAGQFDICDGACGAVPFRGTDAPPGSASFAESSDSSPGLEEARLDPLLAVLSAGECERFFANVRAHRATAQSPQDLYDAFESAVGGAANAGRILERFRHGGERGVPGPAREAP